MRHEDVVTFMTRRAHELRAALADHGRPETTPAEPSAALIEYLQHKPDCDSWPRTSFKCSGCGYVTVDLKAATSCKGYCQNSRPFSDPHHCKAAFPCPGCQRLHYWGGNGRIVRSCTCGLDALRAALNASPPVAAAVPQPPDWVGRCPCGAVVLNHGDRCSRCEVAAAVPEGPQDEEIVVAMLAACEAVIRHLWDIAGHFDSKQCNAIRDEIHILNKLTLPSIKDLGKRLSPPVADSVRPEP